VIQPLYRRGSSGRSADLQPEKCLEIWGIPAGPLDVDTKYYLPRYEEPTENNVIEAMEAWILREAIRALPPEAPILTCHDEVLSLTDHVPLIRTTWWESSILRLAKYCSTRAT